jgi:hypothetical protein
MRNLILAIAMLIPVLPAFADRPKTSDVLIVSGLRAIQKWKSGDEQSNGKSRVYVAFDSIFLAPRESPAASSTEPQPKKADAQATPATPIDVNVWIRGIPEASLILVDERSGAQAMASACGSARQSQLKLRVSSPVTVWYSVCFSAERFDKAQGEIIVMADNADPERFNITFERQEGFFTSPIANTLLSPALTALAGIVAGAVIGYLGFLAQQQYLRRTEQMKGFRERKLQSMKSLIDFFRDTYDVYRYPQEEDPVDLKQLRDVLIQSNIYAILAPDEIGKLNRICNAKFEKSQLKAFDRIMADNFDEFIKQR